PLPRVRAAARPRRPDAHRGRGPRGRGRLRPLRRRRRLRFLRRRRRRLWHLRLGQPPGASGFLRRAAPADGAPPPQPFVGGEGSCKWCRGCVSRAWPPTADTAVAQPRYPALAPGSRLNDLCLPSEPYPQVEQQAEVRHVAVVLVLQEVGPGVAVLAPDAGER